jgi:hypothetical protein
VTGILLTILSMAVNAGYFPDRKWIFIASDIIMIAAAILVIWGVVLVVRSKIRK